MRNIDELKTTANRRIYKKMRRFEIANMTGACTYCGPHSGENSKYKKHKIKKEYQLDPKRSHNGRSKMLKKTSTRFA